MTTSTPRLVLGAVMASVLALTGCSATPAASPVAASSAPAANDMLARHGLQGLTVKQIIEKLDAATDDRVNGPAGSVRPSELVLSDRGEQISMPIPGDEFYLAVAPYVTRTHDCFNHNLATCQGELNNRSVNLKITTSDGTTILDQDVTTYANGFASVWVPRNITGTLTVTYDGKTATAPLSTGAGDATCLTTLKLA